MLHKGRTPRAPRINGQTRTSQTKDRRAQNLEDQVKKLKAKLRLQSNISVDAGGRQRPARATLEKAYGRMKWWEDWWASLPLQQKRSVKKPLPQKMRRHKCRMDPTCVECDGW